MKESITYVKIKYQIFIYYNYNFEIIVSRNNTRTNIYNDEARN